MPKCRKKPAGQLPFEPIEMNCNESSLDSQSVYEMSHNVEDLDLEPELEQEIICGKRLADQPYEVLETQIKE